MNLAVVGYCNICGAPIYASSVWMGTIPPPSTPSCGCKMSKTYIYDTNVNVKTNVKFPEAFAYKTKPTKAQIIKALKQYQEDVTTKADDAAFEAVIEWFINCTPDSHES